MSLTLSDPVCSIGQLRRRGPQGKDPASERRLPPDAAPEREQLGTQRVDCPRLGPAGRPSHSGNPNETLSTFAVILGIFLLIDAALTILASIFGPIWAWPRLR